MGRGGKLFTAVMGGGGGRERGVRGRRFIVGGGDLH